MIPVVKTAVTVLSKLHREYRTYSVDQKRIFLLQLEIKKVKNRLTFLRKKAKSLGITPSHSMKNIGH